jgi:hypothetical protein
VSETAVHGGAIMRKTLRLIVASIAVIFASFPLSTREEVATTQIMRTDKHI